jgi:hypothetical protein
MALTRTDTSHVHVQRVGRLSHPSKDPRWGDASATRSSPRLTAVLAGVDHREEMEFASGGHMAAARQGRQPATAAPSSTRSWKFRCSSVPIWDTRRYPHTGGLRRPTRTYEVSQKIPKFLPRDGT